MVAAGAGEGVPTAAQASNTTVNVVLILVLTSNVGDLRVDALALTMTYSGDTEPQPLGANPRLSRVLADNRSSSVPTSDRTAEAL